MKQRLIFTLLFLCSLSAFAQVNNIVFNAGVAYTDGPPTFNPGGKGSRIAVDLVTKKIYTHTVGTTWALYGNTLQVTTGCVPPAYVPVGFQSDFVINACDSLYMYRGGDWRHLNAGGGGGGSYTAGTGIDITANVISNTLPSLWTDGGASTYLTSTSDDVAIGATSANSKVEIRKDGISSTQTNTSGLLLSTATPAVSGGQQYSPAIRWRANGWKAASPAASQPLDFQIYAAPVQTLSEASGVLHFRGANNSGTYYDLMKLGSYGQPTSITKVGSDVTGLVNMVEDGKIAVSSTKPATGQYSDFRLDYSDLKFRSFIDFTNYSLFEVNTGGFASTFLDDDKSGTFQLIPDGLEIFSSNTTIGATDILRSGAIYGFNVISNKPSGDVTIETIDAGTGDIKFDVQTQFDVNSHINKLDFKVDSTRLLVGDLGKPTYIGIGQNSVTIGNDGVGGNNYVKYDALDPFNYLKYTSDKSADIAVDDRAILDVGTLKSGLVPNIPRVVADATALNGELYYSTDTSKLCYKDAGGTIIELW